MAEKKKESTWYSKPKRAKAASDLATSLAKITSEFEASDNETEADIATGLTAGLTGISSGAGAAALFASGGVGLAVGAAVAGLSLYSSSKKKEKLREEMEKRRKAWQEGLRKYKEQLKGVQKGVKAAKKQTIVKGSELFKLSEEAVKAEQKFLSMDVDGAESITAKRAIESHKEQIAAFQMSEEDRLLQKLDALDAINKAVEEEIDVDRETFDSFRTRKADVIQEKLEELEKYE